MDRRAVVGGMTASLISAMAPWAATAKLGDRRLKAYLRTNWSQDPFSFGSYSYIAKGASRRDHRALETPIDDKVFFAGEAVHPNYNSTVHAAYESGQRAAAAVIETGARRIAVIGAGMSGLSAAHALSKLGRDVVVYDARARIGGRIWTDDRLGPPVDLGASWIHGVDGNPLTALADALGQERVATEEAYVIRGGDGRRIADREAPEWLDDVIEVQHTAGADVSQLNMFAYLFSDGYDGVDVKFPNGYGQIFDALRGDYAVALERQVTRVTIGENGVALGIGDDASDHDAVIVTVPLGVLKQGAIAFEPPLPDRKRRAIERLGMGLLDKVYLLFEEPFWDADATWIVTPENDLPPGQFNQWLNLHKYVGAPLLLAFNGGPPAFDLAAMPDNVLVERGLQTLAMAYPPQR